MEDEMIKRCVEFVDQAQDFVNTYMEQNFPTLDKRKLVPSIGKRYFRIEEHSVGGSYNEPRTSIRIWGFIDMNNGDILKPANFKAPAKHARGNIFDDDYGMRNMGPYGPLYMNELAK